MPKNRRFSLRVVVGDAELPEYWKNGVCYIECPLDTPFSYLKQTQEMKDGEAEIQMIPVTPYKIKIYARQRAKTHFYRIRIDGQAATPITCPPQHSRYSSGFIKDGNVLEYLFSLPKLVANKDEKVPKDLAPKVGTISAECWMATPVDIRDVDYRLSFKQAAKQDSPLVTNGLYTMTTTTVGKELTTNRPTRTQIWRLKTMMSKLTLHYRLASDLQEMGFELKRIPFCKRYPSDVLPDSVLRNQQTTNSSHMSDSRTGKPHTQPPASPERSNSESSDVESSSEVPGTSRTDSPKDSSMTPFPGKSAIKPVQRNSTSMTLNSSSASPLNVGSSPTLTNQPTSDVTEINNSPASEKASKTGSQMYESSSSASEDEDKGTLRLDQTTTLDAVCRNESIIVLSSEDETDDKDLIIISASEFNQGVDLKTQNTVPLSTSSFVDQSKLSLCANNSKNSQVYENLPTDSPIPNQSTNTTSMAKEDKLRDVETAQKKSVTDCTKSLTSDTPFGSLHSTGNTIEGPPKEDQCTDIICEPKQSKLAPTLSASSIPQQLGNVEAVSLQESTTEVMDMTSNETPMDCANESTGPKTKSNTEGVPVISSTDGTMNTHFDNVSKGAMTAVSGSNNKTALDENGNIKTMQSLNLFECESETTTDNSQDLHQLFTSALKGESKNAFLSTTLGNEDDKSDDDVLTTRDDNYRLKIETYTNTQDLAVGITSPPAFVQDVKPLSSRGKDLRISKRKLHDTKNTPSDNCNMHNCEFKRMKVERDPHRRLSINKTPSGLNKDWNGNLDNRPKVFVERVSGSCLLEVDVKKELMDEEKNRE